MALFNLTIYAALVFPFVNPEGGGYDLDLIKEVTGSSKVVYLPSIPDVLEAVRLDNNSVGISSITITSAREQHVDFTHSYLESGLQVMVNNDKSFNSMVSRLVSNSAIALSIYTAVMIAIVLLMTPIAYLFENFMCPSTSTPLFWSVHDDTSYDRLMYGMFRATGWTLFTIFGTHTSYPNAMATRAVHGFLKIISALMFIIATAMFAAVFTNSYDPSSISGYNDLTGTVCTVNATTSHDYLLKNPRDFSIEVFKDTSDLFDAFRSGVCSIVYDAPVLQAARDELNGNLVGPVFQPEAFGITVHHNSTFMEQLQVSLLNVLENREFMGELESRYLSSSDHGGSLSIPDAWIIVPSVLGVGLTIVLIVLLYRNLDSRQEEFKKTHEDNFDTDYRNDHEDVAQYATDNLDIMFGTDFKADKNYTMLQRVLRVIYEVVLGQHVLKATRVHEA